MTRTSTELEEEFLQQLENRTGKSLVHWMSMLQGSGFRSRPELLNLLKETHGWTHLPAQLMVGIFLNDGKPVYKARPVKHP